MIVSQYGAMLSPPELDNDVFGCTPKFQIGNGAEQMRFALRLVGKYSYILLTTIVWLTCTCGLATAADLVVYDDALASNWHDWSWNITRNLDNTAPVQSGSRSVSVSFTTAWGGFSLNRYEGEEVTLSGYEKLRFWIHGGTTGNQQVRIVINGTDSAITVTATANTWTQVEIPFSDLGSPAALSSLYWQDATGGTQAPFYLDTITLVAGTVTPPSTSGPALSIDAAAGRHAISPDIYGMNFASESLETSLHIPVNRRGGNATSRYNWQNDTTNTGMDWYFENIPLDNPTPALLPNGSDADRFVEQDRRTGAKSIITIPLIGWVAKQRPASHPYDCGFKVSRYGSQDSVDPWDTDCGNGIKNSINLTGNNPTDTSVATTPGFVSGWLNHLISRYGTAANGGVAYYSLDNEPMLWNSTHRDIHPQPTSYDELRDTSQLYAPLIKAADPTAKTLGPALWGWPAYFYSALDQAAGGTWWETRPDRKAHGDIPFVAWYLQQMQTYEQQHGVRILDYLDLHFYPQAQGVTLSTAGSAATQALRLRSTRALWDATYVDESWIGEAVQLIPRMKEWVNANYPGTKLAITEYNWGGLESINGALAQADVLGIFGREGLDLATLWGLPTATQPGAFAFRMYRNYDGAGHAFGETSVQATSADQEKLAVYAAQRSSDGHLTAIIINKTGSDLISNVSLSNFPVTGAVKVFRYSTTNLAAIEQLTDLTAAGGTFSTTFPANSLTLLEFASETYPLAVAITGSGKGRVISSPVGIDCQSGLLTGCSASFGAATSVLLLPELLAGSHFTRWEGACSGSAGCSVSMTGAKTVTAIFTANTIIGNTGYATLQEAYNAAKEGELIKLAAGTKTESLVADRAIAISIAGGYDSNFEAREAQTVLQGAITLQKGTITLDGIVLR